MTELTVTIPGTVDHKLTPNGTRHRMERYRLNEELKERVGWAIKAGYPQLKPMSGPVELLYIVFWEAGRKRMDADNFCSAMKGAQDAIAAAIGVNDKHFIAPKVIQTRDEQGRGFIEIHIRSAAESESAA